MKGQITIVGFGDSITEARIGIEEGQSWLRLLDAMLVAAFPRATFKLVNAGVGGNSAREAMARLDRDVLVHVPDFVLLEFGGNNSDPANPGRHVPPDEFKALLKRFRESLPPGTGVVVITFPPVFKEAHAYWRNPVFRSSLEASERNGMGIDDYVEMAKEFAVANGFPVYDLNAELTALGARDGWRTYTLPDGVHLTAAGNHVLADGVFGTLSRLVLG